MTSVVTKNFTWIDVQNPTSKEIHGLRDNFGFHELNLEDCLSSVQRPKVDTQDNYIFIVLHFPRYLKNLKRMITSEVNIFLGENFMVTVHHGNLKPLNRFYDEMNKNTEALDKLTSKGSAMLLYELISLLFDYCFPIVDKMSERIGHIDDVMFREKASKIVTELAHLNQEIITFRKIISPERAVMKDLEEKIKPFLAHGNDLYFDDITDAIEKIWDTLENLKEVSESLQRSHDSYVNYQLNETMKILTIFSAILLPLNLITSFYGMNIRGLPYADHIQATGIITLGMILLVLTMLHFFKKKNIL